jgi:polyphosphate kinase 2 (PPK2 family)
MKLYSIAKRFRIDKPDKFRLSRHDPAECCGLTVDKQEAQAMLAGGIEELAELQQRLYADGRWSVLIVLQAMDAAGKDSIIKHVMSGINPQGCEVHSFKQPSAEELQHDFLWRVAQRLPTNGRIGIFNRSHYEEVLTVRVHKELLERQKLPKQLVDKDIWQQRFDDIRAFERHRPQRHADPEVLPECIEGRAARAISRPHRRAGQALEVFLWATSSSANFGINIWPPTRK